MTIGGNEKNATTKLEKHLDDVWASFFFGFLGRGGVVGGVCVRFGGLQEKGSTSDLLFKM